MSDIKFTVVCAECGADLECDIVMFSSAEPSIKIAVGECTQHGNKEPEQKQSCLSCKHCRLDCNFNLGSMLEQTSRLKDEAGHDCDGWEYKEGRK